MIDGFHDDVIIGTAIMPTGRVIHFAGPDCETVGADVPSPNLLGHIPAFDFVDLKNALKAATETYRARKQLRLRRVAEHFDELAPKIHRWLLGQRRPTVVAPGDVTIRVTPALRRLLVEAADHRETTIPGLVADLLNERMATTGQINHWWTTDPPEDDAEAEVAWEVVAGLGADPPIPPTTDAPFPPAPTPEPAAVPPAYSDPPTSHSSANSARRPQGKEGEAWNWLDQHGNEHDVSVRGAKTKLDGAMNSALNLGSVQIAKTYRNRWTLSRKSNSER